MNKIIFFFIIWALPQESGLSLYLFVFKEKTKRMPLQPLTQKNEINFNLNHTINKQLIINLKKVRNNVLEINKLDLFCKNIFLHLQPVKSGINKSQEKLVFNYANNSTISKNRENPND